MTKLDTYQVLISLKFYLIQNQEGCYFRAKGYGGSGLTWVEDANKAKVYLKIGVARAQVSFFANTYPQYGVPRLIEMEVTHGTILDESERVAKAQKAKQKALLAQEAQKLAWERLRIQNKQAALDRQKAALGIS